MTESGLIELSMLDGQGALAALNRSEIDIQISTAKAYPRDAKKCVRDAREMALEDEETAADMFFSVPRAGKAIQGPSVRLAEVMACCWGNLRYGATILAIDDKFVTARGVCFDLERNISAAVEAKRRITDKSGRRFSDDMIQTTANAACSIALRQAIFKIIPQTHIRKIFEAAKKVATGGGTRLRQRVAAMIDYFAKMDVSEDAVLTAIGKPFKDQVTQADLENLKGLATAIRDGDTTIDEAFPPIYREKPSQARGGPKLTGADLDGGPKKLAPEAPQELTSPMEESEDLEDEEQEAEDEAVTDEEAIEQIQQAAEAAEEGFDWEAAPRHIKAYAQRIHKLRQQAALRRIVKEIEGDGDLWPRQKMALKGLAMERLETVGGAQERLPL